MIGIATDFTASTPLPVTRDGTPLCQLPDLDRRPHAYAKLWKHHAAQPQADLINAVAGQRGEPWLARYGGKISSEWQYATALQVLTEDPETYHQADRWIEAADRITWQLCGTETRNARTAGSKGIRHPYIFLHHLRLADGALLAGVPGRSQSSARKVLRALCGEMALQ